MSLTLVTSAKTLLSCKGTYSQAPEITKWISLEASYLSRSFYNPHFTEEETEAGKSQGTCLEPRLKPRMMGCGRHFT